MNSYSETDIQRFVEKAIELHYLKPNCNCAQSVACALSDAMGIDAHTSFCAMEGFGAGMGNYSQTCGALTGAVYLLSMHNSVGFDTRSSKAATYELVKALVEDFEQEFGATSCAALRKTDAEDPKKICDAYIAYAVKQAARAL